MLPRTVSQDVLRAKAGGSSSLEIDSRKDGTKYISIKHGSRKDGGRRGKTRTTGPQVCLDGLKTHGAVRFRGLRTKKIF